MNTRVFAPVAARTLCSASGLDRAYDPAQRPIRYYERGAASATKDKSKSAYASARPSSSTFAAME